jgi:hypothetical protein
VRPASSLAALGMLIALGETKPARAATERMQAAEDRAERMGRSTERDVDRLGWAVPDFAKLQTGSFAGLIAVGVGYALFDDVLNASLLYGYTPAWHAGTTAHSIDLSLDVRPLDMLIGEFRIVPVYFGAGLLVALDDQLFFTTPARYPADDYYPPTALHWTAHLGVEVDLLPARDSFFERHGLYAELTTMDTYFFAYFENRETLDLTDALSSGFGYRAAF